MAPVALTEKGAAEAERLVRALVAVEETMLADLTASERSTLDKVLGKLDRSAEPLTASSLRAAQTSHKCYGRRMTSVASRELRNNTRQLLDRVAHGERVTITVSGIAVATLVPAERRDRWTSRQAFLSWIETAQADAGLRDELQDLLGDESTDDLDFS